MSLGLLVETKVRLLNFSIRGEWLPLRKEAFVSTSLNVGGPQTYF